MSDFLNKKLTSAYLVKSSIKDIIYFLRPMDSILNGPIRSVWTRLNGSLDRAPSTGLCAYSFELYVAHWEHQE